MTATAASPCGIPEHVAPEQLRIEPGMVLAMPGLDMEWDVR